MALINRAGQEISAKVVYYGPGLCGKTTNLEALFKEVAEDRRGKMISMKTRTDRTLFFDLLPMNADPIHDFQVRILLYTVPGQVYYNATRRLVLKGVDALVFVADSQRDKMDENIESLENLRQNLDDMGLKLDELPWVLQYNKRDLPDVATIEELETALNPGGISWFESVATRGEGVHETLRGVAGLLRPLLEKQIEEELGLRARERATQEIPGAEAPVPAPQPATESPATDSAPAQAMPPAPPAGAQDDAPAPLPGSGLAEVDLDDLPEPLVVDLPMIGEDPEPAPASEQALPGYKLDATGMDSGAPPLDGVLVVEEAPPAPLPAPDAPAQSPAPAATGESFPPDVSAAAGPTAPAAPGAAAPPVPPAAMDAPPAADAPVAAPPAEAAAPLDPAPGDEEPGLAESLPPSSDASDTPTMVEAKLLLSPTGQMPEIQVRLPRRLLESGELRLRLLISEEKELSPVEGAREPELLRAE